MFACLFSLSAHVFWLYTYLLNLSLSMIILSKYLAIYFVCVDVYSCSDEFIESASMGIYSNCRYLFQLCGPLL